MARKLALVLLMILVPGGLIAVLLAWLAARSGLLSRWTVTRDLIARRRLRRLEAPAIA